MQKYINKCNTNTNKKNVKIHFQNGAYIGRVKQQSPLIVFIYTNACTYRPFYVA